MSMLVIACPSNGPSHLAEIPFDDKRTDSSSRNATNTLFYTLHVCGRAATTSDLQPLHAHTWQDEYSCSWINGLIVDMSGEQELKFTAEATVGYGRQHARWNCAVAPTFRPTPMIRLKPSTILKDVEDFITICPRGVFSKEGHIVSNPEACNFCGECADVMDVTPSKNTFTLTFE
eukprot:2819486-Pleurochrysis_carterae.AAC.1